MDDDIAKFDKFFVGKRVSMNMSCVAGSFCTSGTLIKANCTSGTLIKANSVYYIGMNVIYLNKRSLTRVLIYPRNVEFIYKGKATLLIHIAE